MAYINITEYDNTITGPKSSTGNVVVIPINASDGPSDRWVTLHTYDEFVQIFGANPSPNSTFGNSWEYAANLLMRKMPVCVRRITNVLNEQGDNTETLLSGVETAKGIIKVKSLDSDTDIISNYNWIDMEISDPTSSTILKPSDNGTTGPNPQFHYENGLIPKINSIYDLHVAYSDEFKNKIINNSNGTLFNVTDTRGQYPFIETNNEWRYMAPKNNPYYHEVPSDYEGSVRDYLLETNGQPAAGEVDYVDGDFFIKREYDDDGELKYNRFDYSATPQENPLFLDANKVYVSPEELLTSYKVLSTWHLNNKDESGNDISTLFNVNGNIWEHVVEDGTNTVVLNNSFKQPTSSNALHTINFILGSGKKQEKQIIYPFSSTDSLNLEIGQFAYTLTKNDDDTFVLTLNHMNNLNGAYLATFEKYQFNITGSTDISDNIVKVLSTQDSVNPIEYNLQYASTYNEDTKGITLNIALPTPGDISVIGNPGTRNISTMLFGSGITSNLAKQENNNNSDDITNILFIDIPFSQVKDSNGGISEFGKGRYRQTYNWIDGADRHPGSAKWYLSELCFEETNNEIGTTPTTITVGQKTVINSIKATTIANARETTFDLSINNYKNLLINKDADITKLSSGNVVVTNISTSPINIYRYTLSTISANNDTRVVYNSNLENLTSNNGRITLDSLLKFTDYNGSQVATPELKIDNTSGINKVYFELQPGYSITYNMDLSSSILYLEVAGYDDRENGYGLDIKVMNSEAGTYLYSLTSQNRVELSKQFIDNQNYVEEDFNDLPIKDGYGNYNIFKAEYLYPGTNGNDIKVSVRTIPSQGIFIYVYKNLQYLERIELCSFRYTLNNGRVGMLDLVANKLDIWKIILTKFNIMLPYASLSQPTSIYGNYVKISINENLENYESLSYITSLYGQNGNITHSLKGGSNPSDEHIQHEIRYCYEALKDKYRYDITFVTNGGFIDKTISSNTLLSKLNSGGETRAIEDAMLDLVTTRKDCVTYLDVPYDLALEDVPYYFEHISTSYAAAYDPWGLITLATGGTKWMPPSFVELYTHAKSMMNGSKLYLPPAGVKRGSVPEILKTNHDLSSKYITMWQDSDSFQFINPIIWINGYDYTVFGQKTLYNIVDSSNKKESALQNLNVRLVANYIKKIIFNACLSLTFELNNLLTWNEFKSKVEPELSTLHGEGVLLDYSVLMGVETMTSADLQSGHINGIVRASIANAVTDWDIAFEITPNDITFNELDYGSTYNE